jgi:hypothetical protein
MSVLRIGGYGRRKEEWDRVGVDGLESMLYCMVFRVFMVGSFQ